LNRKLEISVSLGREQETPFPAVEGLKLIHREAWTLLKGAALNSVVQLEVGRGLGEALELVHIDRDPNGPVRPVVRGRTVILSVNPWPDRHGGSPEHGQQQ
jgi:hypothetical protein